MYRVTDPFKTSFAFSRFDSAWAMPRNVTAMRKRRVALVATKRPAATGAFTLPLGGRPSTKGWRTYATSVGGLESKYGGAVDLAPDLGF